MDASKLTEYEFRTDNKKRKSTSFLGKLFGITKKNNGKGRKDDSFQRESSLYHSFHCTSIPQGNTSQDEVETFTTLESNAFSDIQKDAGIIFLNKNPITNCMTVKEEDKHVQFVPTPMNKYYKVDVKSAPANRMGNEENKENVQHKTPKPSKPILRSAKSKNFISSVENILDKLPGSNKMKVNVSYVDGPQVKKTPIIPRTSTKLALFDRKNGSMPQLNVSGIAKYGSLPRNVKTQAVKYKYETSSDPDDYSNKLIFPDCQQRGPSYVNIPDPIGHENELRQVNKIGCCSIPDIPNHFEQRNYQHQEVVRNKKNRFNVGGPLIVQTNAETMPTNNYRFGKNAVKYESMLQNPQVPVSYNQSTTMMHMKMAQSNTESDKAQFRKPFPKSSQVPFETGDPRRIAIHFPNKAMNEVGLPKVVKVSNGKHPLLPQNSITENPQYIHLHDTVSGMKSNKTGYDQNAHFAIPDIPKKYNIQKSQTGKMSQIEQNVCNYNSSNSTRVLQPIENIDAEEYNHFISQARRQVIRSSMYIQRKKFVSKMCKYKSKECEDGFSSMADDECSFNCSCPTCTAKFSRQYKRNFSRNEEDNFFFVCTTNEKESTIADRVLPPLPEQILLELPKQVLPQLPERVSLPDPVVPSLSERIQPLLHEQAAPSLSLKAVPPLSQKVLPQLPAEVEPPFTERPLPPLPENISSTPLIKKGINSELPSNSNKTWYDCDDSLCKTPVISKNNAREGNLSDIPEEFKEDRLVETIYENIAQIINSATKRNFKTSDVERMFSTPVSNLKLTKVITENVSNNKKISRALFTSSDNLQAPGSPNLKKKIQSPPRSPVVFSDSVLLLQEIFQKLSHECKELLQPNESLSNDETTPPINSSTNMSAKGSKYVNDLVRNLRSKDLSEGDFASIIGGIAQNIFLEAKLKCSVNHLSESMSLPDLSRQVCVEEVTKKKLASESTSTLTVFANKLEDSNGATSDSGIRTEMDVKGDIKRDPVVEERDLPEGWSRTPTTESNSVTDQSSNSKDSSKGSESDLQLLENVIRLGMGLSPVDESNKSFYAASPVKATKYKSKDVLSGKGKLKLKIYSNSGLVTVHVSRAAKLTRVNGGELNSYVKISMVPDEIRRVHWRTSVQKAHKNPVFNQKFSFELLSEDVTKRLVFSVWHRDFAKERSELVGCMSFSVRHVMDETHKIDGWYRLLREGFGTQKHFAAHARKNFCSKK